MLGFAKRLLRRSGPQIVPLSFDRPLLILQSDDWGRVGVRDRDGYEQFLANGIPLGARPYDFYTLETAEDVIALRDMLKRHCDSTGRPACMVMNFILANLDFAKMARGGFQQILLRWLSQGLPGNWLRPGLFEAYREGVADQVFFPALHGTTHFCRRPVEYALANLAERRELLHKFWTLETPYIHWRMPWIGYEYWNPESPQAGFLGLEEQTGLIREAASEFRKFFSRDPVSACAPGYRADKNTRLAWVQNGIRVAQNGSGSSAPPHMDKLEILNLYRNIDFEPALGDLAVVECMRLAESCFSRGLPAIVSVHSINFHSSLKDFRAVTLPALGQFLSLLEAKYPNLLYVHDQDIHELVLRGKFHSDCGTVVVNVKQKAQVPLHRALVEN